METRVAAYAVIVDAGRLLLAHWRVAERSGWTLPGGGLDPGEDPRDAVVREVHEETGFAAVVEALLGVDSLVVPAAARTDPTDQPLHALRIVYRARVVGGALRDEVDGSTDRAEWFHLDRVEELTDRVELVDAALRFAGLLGPLDDCAAEVGVPGITTGDRAAAAPGPAS